MSSNATDKRDMQSFLDITENRSRLLAVIIAMVRDFDAAEELFQETVVEILRSQDRYVHGRAFYPWACGIARNVVRRYWERENRKPVTLAQEVLARLAQIATDTEPDLWRREQAALQVCLQKLPPRQNRLFVLRYGHNLKGQNLAERARIKQGSIRTTLARLRGQLRRCIEHRLRSLQAGVEL